MRQISDLLTTPESGNTSTCGFFTLEGGCGRGFRNLPHTSVMRFRKCGETRDLPTRPQFRASATCGFVAKNQVVLGGFKFLPALPKIGSFSNDMRCPRVLCQVRRALRKLRPSQPTPPSLVSIMASDNHNAPEPRYSHSIPSSIIS